MAPHFRIMFISAVSVFQFILKLTDKHQTKSSFFSSY